MRVRKKISQREALRLRKRVNQLLKERHEARSPWANEYPGGVNFATVNMGAELTSKMELAEKFSDTVVVKRSGATFRFYAIPR